MARGGATASTRSIHLAAKVNVVGAWPDYLAANVDGTARSWPPPVPPGSRRFVQVSSPSVAHARPVAGGRPGRAGRSRARPRALQPQQGDGRAARPRRARPGFAVVAVRPHLVWGPGDTQLVGADRRARARAGRLALVGGGTALIDTTYVDNAAVALVAAARPRRDRRAASAYVVVERRAAPGRRDPRLDLRGGRRTRAPASACPTAWPGPRAPPSTAVWARRGREDDPPITRFLAEQLATAHWFDQRRTREALHWAPTVGARRRLRPAGRGFPRATTPDDRVHVSAGPTGLIVQLSLVRAPIPRTLS